MNTAVTQYFATFGYQAAIGGAVALAIMALWFARPRRTAVFWAGDWALLAGGQLAGIMALRANHTEPYGPAATFWWAVALACFALALMAVVLGTRSLTTESVPVRVRPVPTIVLAAAGVAIAVWRVNAERAVAGNFIESSALFVRVSSISVSLWAAWELRRSHCWQDEVGLRVLAWSQLLVAARAMLSLALAFQLLPTELGATLTDWLVPLQVVVQVFYGAGTLVAVLADEQRERLANESRLQAFERSLLEGQRLEELGRMAGGVAHDFNNLLYVMQTGAELAKRDVPPDSATALELDGILVAAERGTALTKQLLQFARGGQVAATDFDPNDHIAQLLPIIRRMMPSAIRIQTNTAGPPVTVNAPASQFDQVVLNLVSNARDAMNGAGTLEISTSSDRDAAFVLRVTDSGHGISAEALPNIFEPFFSTKAPSAGTGLGLATCRAVMTRAGGTIDVVSTGPSGTTFEVRLPVRRPV